METYYGGENMAVNDDHQQVIAQFQTNLQPYR